jgi:hypothetical protein
MEQAIAQIPAKKNYTAVIIVGSLFVLAAGFFGFIYKDKSGKTLFQKVVKSGGGDSNMTREEAIKAIEDSLGSKFSSPDGYGTDYLVARASAIKGGTDTFVLNGKTYNAKTGRAA